MKINVNRKFGEKPEEETEKTTFKRRADFGKFEQIADIAEVVQLNGKEYVIADKKLCELKQGKLAVIQDPENRELWPDIVVFENALYFVRGYEPGILMTYSGSRL